MKKYFYTTDNTICTSINNRVIRFQGCVDMNYNARKRYVTY